MLDLRVQLRFFLWMATFDILSIWLLMFFYITKIDFMFLVNINFILMFLLLFSFSVIDFNFGKYLRSKFSLLSSLFLMIFFISFIKLFLAAFDTSELSIKHFFSYSIGILMPLVALSFAKKCSSIDMSDLYGEILIFSKRYAYIAVAGIFLYTILYFTGKIKYFGLGTNLHYVIPFLLSGAKSIVFFLLVILVSGKRAVLLNFLFQISVYYSRFIFYKPVKFFIMFISLVSFLFYIYMNTLLLDRFKVYFNMNFSDPSFIMLAFGGRYEELVGIYKYFVSHPAQLWFGSPPGAYFHWVVEFSDYEATKNYSHVTIFGYIFRYGLIFSVSLYLTFFYYLIRRWDSSNPYFLVFVGILISSIFGANLIIDPTSWFFIGLIEITPRRKFYQKMGFDLFYPWGENSSSRLRFRSGYHQR